MLRFGLIGVGNTVAIAKNHAQALAGRADARITALLSRTRSHTLAFAQAYCPDAKICDTLEELLALSDCVLICSPNATHAAYALAALRAGKHVLCEKPLGGTDEELEQLQRESERCKTVNAAAYNYRFLDAFEKLYARIQSGEFGRILWYAEQKGGNRLANAGLPLEWRMERGTGGSTMDFCSHMLCHALHFTGLQPQQLHLEDAALRRYIPQRRDAQGVLRPVGSEDYSALRLTGENDLSITLLASRVGVPCEQLQIVGTKAMACYNSLESTVFRIWHKDAVDSFGEAEQITCDASIQRSYVRQMDEFIRCVKAGRAMHPTLAEGCQILRLLQQAVKALD